MTLIRLAARKCSPESGGGLLVATIQLAIMTGAAFGGILLDHFSITATMVGGAALLVMVTIVIGGGSRLGAPALP